MFPGQSKVDPPKKMLMRYFIIMWNQEQQFLFFIPEIVRSFALKRI